MYLLCPIFKYKEGMLSMIEDGIVKSVKGFTVIEEVLRVISE